MCHMTPGAHRHLHWWWCRLQRRRFWDKGAAHPDVEKHAKAREADNVHRRKQNVDCEDRLPAPFCQDAAAREDPPSV
jgi:hypothetical protein